MKGKEKVMRKRSHASAYTLLKSQIIGRGSRYTSGTRCMKVLTAFEKRFAKENKKYSERDITLRTELREGATSLIDKTRPSKGDSESI